jgi:hypothetical protein
MWLPPQTLTCFFASLEFICLGVGDFRFASIVLTQKSMQKTPHPSFGHPLQRDRGSGTKYFTTPASLEKLSLGRLKSSKLIPTKYVGTQTRTIFDRLPHWFFGSPDEVDHKNEALNR